MPPRTESRTRLELALVVRADLRRRVLERGSERRLRFGECNVERLGGNAEGASGPAVESFGELAECGIAAFAHVVDDGARGRR